jgi:hypothetical protein
MVFLLLVLLGASLYFPQTRPVVLEYLGPVMNPVLSWQTKGEMGRIARELQTVTREGGDLPSPGASFQAWITRNFLGRAKSDAWGSDYTLRVWEDSVGVISNGPDLEIDTADDIVLSAVRQRRRRDR